MMPVLRVESRLGDVLRDPFQLRRHVKQLPLSAVGVLTFVEDEERGLVHVPDLAELVKDTGGQDMDGHPSLTVQE